MSDLDLHIDATGLDGLGLTATESVLVIAGQQGDVRRYTLKMPPGVLVKSARRPDPEKPFPGNRKVDKSRAQHFADYLSGNAFSEHGWTCPPLQLRAHPNDVSFNRWVNKESGFAVIDIPKFREWDIQDGQHRVLGFALFNEETQARVDELRRLSSHAERNGNRELSEDYKRQTAQLDLVRRMILEDSAVEVVLVVADEPKHRQMFADIAINAKGINPDFATTLDERDPVHRIAKDLLDRPQPFADLVNDGQTGRTSTTSQFLLGAKGFADICRGVIVGSGRVGKRKASEIEGQERYWANQVLEFVLALFESFPDLGRLQQQEIEAPALREESLLGSATMLRVLAIAWHEARLNDAGPHLTVGEMKEFFTELDAYMRPFADVETIDPATGERTTKFGVPQNHALWMVTGKFQPGNKAPSARQGDVNEFGKILAKWAGDGIPSEP